MLKQLAKLILMPAAILVGAGQAEAAREIDVPAANITTTFSGSGIIEVISTDGNTWTEIKDSNLVFPIKVDISVPSGHVVGYKVTTGGQSLKHELFAPFKPTQFSQAMSPTGTTGAFYKPFKDDIIAKCNAQLSGGNGVDETISLTHNATVTLTAWTANASGQSNDPMVRTTQASFPLKCLGKPKPGPYAGSNDVGFDHGDMKVRGIKLFLTTYSHAYSEPNPGTKCKKVKLLVRLNASQKGLVRFKLWKSVGGEMTSKVIDAWAAHDGNGKFKAEHSEWISVDKATYVQAKAEELVNPIGLSTPWEDIMLHCTSAGGEGLTLDPGSNNPDDLPQLETLEGDFGFIDNTGTKCTRKGKALVTFRSPKTDNIHYSLDCKSGSNSGVVPPVPHPDGGYVAAALVSFDIEETIDESCILRTVAPYGPKEHVTKQHLFQCIKRSFDPVTNDFTVDPKPTDNAPKPTVVVDPARDVPPSTGPTVIVDPVRIVCLKGAVRNFRCYCPQRHKKVRFGKNRWRCDPFVVDPPKTPPGSGSNVIVDPVRVVCLRGAVRNNGCYCPQRHKKVRFGNNKWRCDPIVVDPPKTPPGSGPNVIADPPRRISCRNGVVRNKSCFCPRNRKKVRVGRNAWNCVLKATVVPPKKGGSSLNSGNRRLKVAPPVRTLKNRKKRKKKKSNRRRAPNVGNPVQMRMMRRR